jgi:hypothetical protein
MWDVAGSSWSGGKFRSANVDKLILVAFLRFPLSFTELLGTSDRFIPAAAASTTTITFVWKGIQIPIATREHMFFACHIP